MQLVRILPAALLTGLIAIFDRVERVVRRGEHVDNRGSLDGQPPQPSMRSIHHLLPTLESSTAHPGRPSHGDMAAEFAQCLGRG